MYLVGRFLKIVRCFLLRVLIMILTNVKQKMIF